MEVVLASASPRRQQLLRTIGLSFRVAPADVDESWRDGEAPIAYVARIAHDKADVVAERLGRPDATTVLAADTTVDLDGEALGKPIDDDEARRMLERLAGRTHVVHTAVVGWTATGVHEAVVSTDVMFARLSDEGIDWYLSLGEHRDKAGAYGLQGAGGALVHRIEGSASNVIGLPLAETIGLLRACGVHLVGGGAGPRHG